MIKRRKDALLLCKSRDDSSAQHIWLCSGFVYVYPVHQDVPDSLRHLCVDAPVKAERQALSRLHLYLFARQDALNSL